MSGRKRIVGWLLLLLGLTELFFLMDFFGVKLEGNLFGIDGKN
jgi:hypothetical protein